MIVRAVALPGTPLLVPGVAGRAVVLARTREHVLEALGELVRDARRVVVLDGGARRPGARRGVMRPALESVGVDPRWWGWSPRASTEDTAAAPAAGAAASAALLALDAAGWRGPAEVVELGAGATPAAAVALAHEVLADPGARLVIVTGTRAPAPGAARSVQPDGAPTTRSNDPGADAPLGDAAPSDTGARAGAAVERALLDALARAGDLVVERSTGEYEQWAYEVVRFSAPAPARVATLPG